jgi:DNA-binding response OmpR family regulator
MPREFALLSYLMDHPDEACTRDQILDAVWGIDFDTGTNMVDVYMHFLRKKLEAHGIKGIIQTIRGRGYRLAVQTAPGA